MSHTQAAGPLSGVRVVDFTQFVAGPHCTLWLASLGAEVIRIESPKRPDPFRLSLLKRGEHPTLNNSAVFVGTNLMKQSVALDVKTEAGLDLCRQLISKSDVVVSNFRPGVLALLGLGDDVLQALNEDLIIASLSGFGSDSDYAAFLALGPSIHAYAGLSASTGYPDGRAEQIFGTYSDVMAGQAAALAVMAAIFGREPGAGGCVIDVSMVEAMIAVAPEAVLRAAQGEDTPPVGNVEEGFAPHGCYPCAGGDDSWIAIATFDDDDWRRLGAVLELADDVVERFAELGERWERRAELDEVIAAATVGRTAVELADELQSVGVAAEQVRTASDVLEDKFLTETGFLAEVEHRELKAVPLPKLPVKIGIDGVTDRPTGPAPDLGEHTYAVMREILGLSVEEIEAAHARGAFGSTSPMPGLERLGDRARFVEETP